MTARKTSHYDLRRRLVSERDCRTLLVSRTVYAGLLFRLQLTGAKFQLRFRDGASRQKVFLDCNDEYPTGSRFFV
jgi:hypothetical protein